MRTDLVPALRPLADRLHTSYCWVRRTGENPKRINQPLTDAKLAKHLNGGPAYGASPIAPGQNTTRVAVLDLDSHKGETSWADMQRVGITLMEDLESHGLNPVPFRSSGGQGIHIYLLWSELQDAYSVRALLLQILGAAGLSNGTQGVAHKQVEIFPKADSVPADGFGSMFILPLAGASVPLDRLELEDLDKDDANEINWEVSPPVTYFENTKTQIRVLDKNQSLTQAMHTALAAIPNSGNQELGYDEWRNIIFALHYETDGSSDGLAIAHEFSSRAGKYDSAFLENRVWPYAKSERNTAITGRTILAKAREYGWTEDVSEQFEVVKVTESNAHEAKELPKFTREKSGAILATIDNLALATRDTDCCAAKVALDEFRDEIMITEGGADWRPFKDTDYTTLRIRLERGGFKPISREAMRDAVHLIAEENRFDSAIDWINGLKHDGVARAEMFWVNYCGVVDTPYARACGLYFWSALAGRCAQPGVKADMVPVLIGSQGLRKSACVAAIAPHNDYFKTISLSDRDANLSRKMRRCLVAEIDEMRGLNSADQDAIKSFITRTHEEWTPKYQEFETKFARRLLFVGTANPDEILSDETGNRRWLPLKVTRTIDTDGVEAARDQLWAEGLALFQAGGVRWQEAQRLAVPVHAEHMISDDWTEPVAEWLASCELDEITPRGDRMFTTNDVLTHALRLGYDKHPRTAQLRAARALRELGYEKCVQHLPDRQRKAWRRVASKEEES